jgi:hypothetical protein
MAKKIKQDEQGDVAEASVATTDKRGRSRRAKYITLYSSFLMKETKHELIGEPVVTETGRHQWARCTRSHHSQLINLDTIESGEDKSKSIVSFTKDDVKQYSPTENYDVGDVIFHKVWDDFGIVQRKDTTSDGGQSIVVQFEKNMEKKLVENFGSRK